VIVNLLVFALLELDPGIYNLIALSDRSIVDGKFWTIITPAFVHFGIFHLLLNMAVLWYYGQILEGILGKRYYLLLYFLSAATANIFSYFGHVNMEQTAFYSGGASGPIYGLIGAFVALHLRWRMIPAEVAGRLGTWALLFIVAGFALRGTVLGALDNWAHLGGAAGGFVLIYLFPRPGGR
jgi:membrane associated rhomboid family serine protease